MRNKLSSTIFALFAVIMFSVFGWLTYQAHGEGDIACSAKFSVYRQDEQEGLNVKPALQGTINLNISTTGSISGSFYQDFGQAQSTQPTPSIEPGKITGQATGGAINLVIEAIPGKIFAVGTSTSNVPDCTGTWVGTLVGPEVNIISTWVAEPTK